MWCCAWPGLPTSWLHPCNTFNYNILITICIHYYFVHSCKNILFTRKYWYLVEKPGIIFWKIVHGFYRSRKEEWTGFSKGKGSVPICRNCKESDCDHCSGSHLKCLHHHLSSHKLYRYIYHRITSQSKSSTTIRGLDTLYIFVEDKVTSSRTAFPIKLFPCNVGNPKKVMMSMKLPCYF